MTQTVDSFLQHYGKKGMRWGVRNASRPVTKSGRTKFEKKPHRLTDAELQKRIKRLEMEKRYSDLNKADVTQGKKFASDTTQKIGGTILATLATGAALLAVSAVLGRKNPKLAKELTGKDAAGLLGTSSGAKGAAAARDMLTKTPKQGKLF